MRPGPTARISPSWGFSFAVSGRTSPLFVISSRGVGFTTTRSPSGVSLVAVLVAVAKVFPPGDGAWPPEPVMTGAGRPIDAGGADPRVGAGAASASPAPPEPSVGRRSLETGPFSTLGVRVLAILGACVGGCQPAPG